MIKRPFALLGWTALAVLTLGMLLGAEHLRVPVIACTGLGVICLLFWALRGRRCRRAGFRQTVLYAGAVLLTAAVFLGLFAVATHTRAEPARALAGVKAEIRGSLLDESRRAYGRFYYTVRVRRVRVEGQTLDLDPFTIRMSSWEAFACEPYDQLECAVTFYGFNTSGGLYSTHSSLLAEGIVLGAYRTGPVTVIPSPDLPPGEIALRLRTLIGRSFAQRLPGEETGLIRAMLLGEREQIDSAVYTRFTNIGASHLLVISGLHMAAIAAFLRALFDRLHLGRRGGCILTAGAILLFLALTGFPVSAVRSGVMYILYLAADCLDREHDGLNALGFALLLICIGNPFAGGDLGLALSAVSTLGILLFSKDITGALLSPFKGHPKIQRIFSPAAGLLGVTFAVMLCSLPILMAVFGGITLLTPLSNLLLIFPCQLLLYLSVTAAVLGLLPVLQPAALPVLFCAGWTARLILKLAELIDRLPTLFLDLTNPIWLTALAAALIITLGLRRLFRGRRLVSFVLAAWVLVFSCGFGANTVACRDVITFCTAADSSAVLVFSGDRGAVLSLGGYQTGMAVTHLRRGNIRSVEALCLSDRGAESRQAAEQVLARCNTERLFLPEGAYIGRDLLLAAENSEIVYAAENTAFTLFDQITVTARDGMRRLELSVYGVDVIIDTGGRGEGRCDLLLTDQPESGIEAALTVLHLEDDYDKADLPPGTYLLPGEDGVYVDIDPDGAMNIRGDADA